MMLSSHGVSLSKDSHIPASGLLDGAGLERQDGVTLLYVNGSYYDMGYQHGFLLRDEVLANMRAFLKYIDEISSYDTMIEIWHVIEPYVPTCHIEEMQGIADGAGIPFETVAACYMTILYMDMQCFTYAAWSNATRDGKLYHVRSLDFPLRIDDPVTGTYIQEHSILIVRNPEDGYKSLLPSIAGGINFYQGINEKQIAIGVEVCWSSDQTLEGIPVQFKMQTVLDTAETIEEAIHILTMNNTLGWNFIVSDAKTTNAYALEITARHNYVGSWDNSTEGRYPFWKIEDVVRRTNFFIEPKLASTQRDRYDPSGIHGLIGNLLKGEPFFTLWRKYKAMSEEIEKNWGSIDLDSGVSLMRKVYTGKTDIVMFFLVRGNKQTILCDFQQWGVCPETGDFVISFADAEKFSHESDLHYFNIYDLFGIERA
jgi:predicted choloylglycine hydrolase